jgi:hypothetical protein
VTDRDHVSEIASLEQRVVTVLDDLLELDQIE